MASSTEAGAPQPVKVIDGATVERVLGMDECIDLMATTQAAISRGEIEVPLRSFSKVANGAGTFVIMPGEIPAATVFGAKLLSWIPDNPGRGSPAIQGQILLFDGRDGRPLALVDAASVTAIRTAAASGAATRALARVDARVLALLGYGVQATTHLAAMLAVRPVAEVRVWGPSHERAARFAQREAARFGVAVNAVATAEEAVSGADLVCTVSSAREPVVEGAWLAPGCHLNLVGAATPDTREVDDETVARARVFTEITALALAEAGDLLQPIAAGHFSADDIVAEIGEVFAGRHAGRSSDEEITLYESLGNVAQDLAAARYVLANC